MPLSRHDLYYAPIPAGSSSPELFDAVYARLKARARRQRALSGAPLTLGTTERVQRKSERASS